MPVFAWGCAEGNAVMGMSSHACSKAVQQLPLLTCKRGVVLLYNIWRTGSVAHCNWHRLTHRVEAVMGKPLPSVSCYWRWHEWRHLCNCMGGDSGMLATYRLLPRQV